MRLTIAKIFSLAYLILAEILIDRSNRDSTLSLVASFLLNTLVQSELYTRKRLMTVGLRVRPRYCQELQYGFDYWI
jgi:hypothetical protein